MSAEGSPARRPRRPTASEVVGGLFVGGEPDSLRFEGARICVRDQDAPPTRSSDVHLPVYDPVLRQPIRENLDRVADRIEQSRAEGRPVLVYCGFGHRRAPLAAVWYLHRVLGIGLDEAYDRVRVVRPGVEHVRRWIGEVSALERG